MAESKLNIVIDSRTAEQRAKDLTRSLQALEQAGIRVSRTLSGQITGNNANAAAAGRNSSSVRTLTNTTNNYNTAAAKAAQSSNALGMGMTSMAATVLSAATAIAGLNAAIAATDNYKAMEGKIRLVTDSAEEFSDVMKGLQKTSAAVGSQLSGNVSVYSKMAKAVSDTTVSTEQLLMLTELIAKAGSIGGDSGESLNAALVQFGQGLSTNFSAAGQELQSMAEQASGLVDVISRGMGVKGIAQLKLLAQEGKLTAVDVLNAILSQQKYVEDSYANLERKSEEAQTALRGEIAKTIRDIDKQIGASQGLVNTLDGISKGIGELKAQTDAGGINAMTIAIGGLTTIIARSLLTSLASAANAVRTKIAAAIADVQATNAQIVATRAQAASDLNAARTTLMRAEGEKARAVIAANAARAAVVAAEAEVMADRAVMASEVQRMRSTISQIEAEKVLEAQRLQAQITDQGRQASITRMAQLQQTQAIVVRELTAAEAQLAATTLASSPKMVAAHTAQTAAIGQQAATTEAATIAAGQHTAAQKAMAASMVTTTGAARGLWAALGGPVGIGIALGAVALGMYAATSASDGMKLSLDKLGNSAEDAAAKFRSLGAAQRQQLLMESSGKIVTQSKELAEEQDAFIHTLEKVIAPRNSGQGLANLQKMIADLKSGATTTTDALKSMRALGISTAGLFGTDWTKKLTDRAAASEKLRASLDAEKKLLADMGKLDAEYSRQEAAAAARAKSGASTPIAANNPNEKGDAELQKLIADARERYASIKDPSAYGAALRTIEEMAKANKPVSAAMREQLLSTARAIDQVTAANALGKVETRQAIRDGKELTRDLERRRDAYADLQSKSSTPEDQARSEFKERKALIDEFADRSNGKHTEMTNWAIAERDREIDSIKLAQAKTLASYENLNASEIDQIRSKYAFERSEVDLMITYTVNQRRLMREALDQAEKTEIKKYGEAEQEKTEALRASFDERYRIELEFNNRIKAIDQSNMSDPEKEMAANVARNVNNDAITGLNKPYTDMMAEVGGESPELLRLKTDEEAKMNIIRDALTQRHITEEEAAAARLQIEKDFMTSRNDLLMSQGEQMLGSMTSIMKSLGGEQSKAYKVMFAIEKGMSIARSIMAIQTGIAMAAANPFPMNIGAMASVAAATANIVTSIQSIKMAGQAHDGIDYVPKEGTWLLDKGERVLSPKQNSDLTNYMQRDDKAAKSDTVVAGGGLNVTIQNYGTSKTYDVQQISESEVRIIARDEVAKGAGKAAAADLSNPNSEMSKGINRNYQTERRR